MNTTPLRKVTDGFYVAPQLVPGDFARARELGIRTVINNRPDGEVSDQLPAADAEAEARRAGLGFVNLPVISGGLTLENVESMRRALAGHEGPTLAYCRSGTRSCNLWALAVAPELAPDRIIEHAADAGFDLEALRPVLARMHEAKGAQ